MLLDQFPRILHPGTAQSHACDSTARAVLVRGVQRGMHTPLSNEHLFFVAMAFSRQEDLASQVRHSGN